MRQVIPSVVFALLAIALLWLSGQVMDGYSDCSVLHGVGPRPADCAETIRLLGHELLNYAGGAAAIGAVAYPAFSYYQQRLSED
jgi:hypothetical protein